MLTVLVCIFLLRNKSHLKTTFSTFSFQIHFEIKLQSIVIIVNILDQTERDHFPIHFISFTLLPLKLCSIFCRKPTILSCSETSSQERRNSCLRFKTKSSFLKIVIKFRIIWKSYRQIFIQFFSQILIISVFFGYIFIDREEILCRDYIGISEKKMNRTGKAQRRGKIIKGEYIIGRIGGKKKMGNQVCCDDWKELDLPAQNAGVLIQRSQNNENEIVIVGGNITKPERLSGSTNSNDSGVKKKIGERTSGILNVPRIFSYVEKHKLLENLPANKRLYHLKNIATKDYIFEGVLDEQNRPSGYGALYQEGKSVFFGHFVEGNADGVGVFLKIDGSFYKGNIKKNVAHDDKGEYHCQDYIYRGGFRNNTFHGEGQQTHCDHNYIFNGCYEYGKKKNGTFSWKEPNSKNPPGTYDFTYIGDFDQNGLFTGKAKLTEPKGTYEGDFVKGKKEGKGTYKFANGLIYKGDYKNGVRSGKGIIFNDDNTVAYEGDFLGGLPNGEGGIYNQNGEFVKSNWIDGIDRRFIQQE